MCFSMLQRLQMPRNMKDFNTGVQGRVLGHNVGDRLSSFIIFYSAHCDSMHHDHEAAALDACSASYSSYPYGVLL